MASSTTPKGTPVSHPATQPLSILAKLVTFLWSQCSRAGL